MSQSTQRLLAIALLVSLALNLLLVGVGVAIWARGEHGISPDRIVGLPSMRRLAEELPDAEREHLREVMRERREPFGRAMHDARDARQHLAEAMRADPVDEATLSEAFAAMRRGDSEVAGEVHAVLIELIVRLNPEQRQRLLRAMGRDEVRHGRTRHRREDREVVPTEPVGSPPGN